METSAKQVSSSRVIDQSVATAKIGEFYDQVGDLLVTTTQKSRRIQLISIVLSVITSGVLWSLIASNYANAAAWAGAVITTVLSFLSLYQATIGPEQKLKSLQGLYGEVGEYYASMLNAEQFDYGRFTDALRRFELKVREIDTEHPIVHQRAFLGSPMQDPATRLAQSKNNQIKAELLSEVRNLQQQLPDKK